ncbi:MAG: transposase, partial [bacterium]
MLGQPEAASIIQDALLFRDGIDYRLLAWVIMPNHVHVVVEPLGGNSLSKIVQAWKSVSSHRIKKVFKLDGPLWYREWFERYIRDEE